MKSIQQRLTRLLRPLDGWSLHKDRWFPVLDPATDQLIAQVPDQDETAVQRLVNMAHRFQSQPDGWSSQRMTQERSRLLRGWHRQMLQHQHDLALLVTLENGKPLKEALGEVKYAASFVEWFAEEAKRMYGDIIPPFAASYPQRLMVQRQSVGVCAMITPWNFPLAMITRKVAPALAAGCAAIVKPSPETALSSQALVNLAVEAGLPQAAFQLLTGDVDTTPKVVSALLSNDRVRKVSVTGSTAVGKLVMRQCADTVKRISLELGGNAPFIVFPAPLGSNGGTADQDAYIQKAVEGLVQAKLRNAGQTCVSPNRIFLHRSLHDVFVERLQQRLSGLRLGHGCSEGDQEVDLGPLINDAAVEKVQRHVENAIRHGAHLAYGSGKPMAPKQGLTERFFEPVVLTGCTSEMQLSCEETFGPVFAVRSFETEAQVVEEANATPSGLAGYFYSHDLAQIWRVADALQVGMVGVNTGVISAAVAPFGGVKQSGLGREGSKYGLDEYTNVKYICMST